MGGDEFTLLLPGASWEQRAETLLKYADLAMYQAKEHGRSQWQIFLAGIGGSSEKELAASSRVILFGLTLKKRPPPVQLNRLHPVVVAGNIGAA